VVGNLEAAVDDLAELSAMLPTDARAIAGELSENVASALEGAPPAGNRFLAVPA